MFTATPCGRRAILAATLLALTEGASARALVTPESAWNVESVRAGMKGYGRTVMHGTKVESFDVEVLGVLKNTSPGRDLVLCRLSGLNLDKTGVIAGMSGSPVYLHGRLLGAVAYAWTFGKEPIAGVTPFTQMHRYAQNHGRPERSPPRQPTRVGLRNPIHLDGRDFTSVAVAQSYEHSSGPDPDGICLVPLKTPLVASGFTSHSLGLLRQRCGDGWLPVQGGGAAAHIAEDAQDVALEPGGPLAVALIRGDFDLSGIGTVTHIEGKRVYGWGHPFLSVGACEFPLMTGYIHTVYPRHTVSFKMGSPLRTVGVITADVSTGIAGWLDRSTSLIPVKMTVSHGPGQACKTFNVEVVRQRSLFPTLVYTALTNSVDMEGDLPEELTANLSAKIEFDGHPPVVIEDVFSGPTYSGGRAPQALYNQVAGVLQALAYNPYQPVHIKRIDCETQIQPGRRTAEIEAIEVHTEVCAPGDVFRATVFVRPYKGVRQPVPVTLPIPKDLPEGVFTVTVCDDLANVRAQLRDDPTLNSPDNLEQIFASLKVQTAARRTNLAVRVPIPAAGVALDGRALPSLPSSMVQIFGSTRKSGAQPIGTALVARHPTDYVLHGSESVRFVVSKNKRVLAD
jgi:hypothetical protein